MCRGDEKSSAVCAVAILGFLLFAGGLTGMIIFLVNQTVKGDIRFCLSVCEFEIKRFIILALGKTAVVSFWVTYLM